jgi:hypothetical protein
MREIQCCPIFWIFGVQKDGLTLILNDIAEERFAWAEYWVIDVFNVIAVCNVFNDCFCMCKSSSRMCKRRKGNWHVE